MSERKTRFRRKYPNPKSIELVAEALKRCGFAPTACEVLCDGSFTFRLSTDESFDVDTELEAWERAHAQ